MIRVLLSDGIKIRKRFFFFLLFMNIRLSDSTSSIFLDSYSGRFSEANVSRLERNGIVLARRNSGGGTVYHGKFTQDIYESRIFANLSKMNYYLFIFSFSN